METEHKAWSPQEKRPDSNVQAMAAAESKSRAPPAPGCARKRVPALEREPSLATQNTRPDDAVRTKRPNDEAARRAGRSSGRPTTETRRGRYRSRLRSVKDVSKAKAASRVAGRAGAGGPAQVAVAGEGFIRRSSRQRGQTGIQSAVFPGAGQSRSLDRPASAACVRRLGTWRGWGRPTHRRLGSPDPQPPPQPPERGGTRGRNRPSSCRPRSLISYQIEWKTRREPRGAHPDQRPQPRGSRRRAWLGSRSTAIAGCAQIALKSDEAKLRNAAARSTPTALFVRSPSRRRVTGVGEEAELCPHGAPMAAAPRWRPPQRALKLIGGRKSSRSFWGAS